MELRLDVPDDFPCEEPAVSLAGTQLKVALNLKDGLYRTRRSGEELLVRYEMCEDLAAQLAAYCLRKEQENPIWTREFNLRRVRDGVRAKMAAGFWDISAQELNWVLARVVQVLGW